MSNADGWPYDSAAKLGIIFLFDSSNAEIVFASRGDVKRRPLAL